MPSLFDLQEYSSIRAPVEDDDKPFLGHADVVDGVVRSYLSMVTEANARYLGGELDHQGLLDAMEAAAAPYVAGFNGQAPEQFQTTPFHTPASIGSYLRHFGDFAESDDEAVKEFFFQIGLQVLKIVKAHAAAEDSPEAATAAEEAVYELVRTSKAMLLGIMPLGQDNEG
jgi:hypothetical protein